MAHQVRDYYLLSTLSEIDVLLFSTSKATTTTPMAEEDSNNRLKVLLPVPILCKFYPYPPLLPVANPSLQPVGIRLDFES